MPVKLNWAEIERQMVRFDIPSRDALAAHTGIHRSHMYKLATGRIQPSMKNLASLCYWFGVQPGDLLEWEPSDEDANFVSSIFDAIKVNSDLYQAFLHATLKWMQSIGLGDDPPQLTGQQIARWKAAAKAFKNLKIKYEKIALVFNSATVQARIMEADAVDIYGPEWKALDAKDKRRIAKASGWRLEFQVFGCCVNPELRDDVVALCQDEWVLKSARTEVGGLPTVAIVDEGKEDDYIVVNKTDYDPSKHLLWPGDSRDKEIGIDQLESDRDILELHLGLKGMLDFETTLGTDEELEEWINKHGASAWLGPDFVEFVEDEDGSEAAY